MAMRVSVPDASWLDSLNDMGLGLELLVWDTQGPQPDGDLDLVLWPYTLDPSAMASVDTSRVGVIQGQSLGFDGVAENLPAGGIFCNAIGVHEESTAELAVTLALASARRLDVFGGQQSRGEWVKSFTSSLIDKRVLLLGIGGIGGEIAKRLDGFGCELIRVGTSARDDERGHVHATSELPQLLPRADVVIVAVPLTEQTAGLIDDDFLAALPDDAIVVNVARGKVVDTDAVLRALPRIRFASDVFDPEPLPDDHPLWTAPNVIITPHVGGMTSAMRPRIEKVVHRQVRALAAGEEPINVAVRT
ncbi:2-hydroxyacid dehydrogenase [Aeromicrobium sp. PE09-221]|uniref:2-hydroxyacid dehydrogenase n=1 Tax=Aeromicrobium sp. PE09-221 TaxID=1898043 RepID=UPI00191C7869|nr:2-hydroxyacid dehydrogenase [Aeromicrobium sp. PE09-221]